MDLMCVSQKERTFCDIVNFDAFVSGEASVFSAEGFLNGFVHNVNYVYKTI